MSDSKLRKEEWYDFFLMLLFIPLFAFFNILGDALDAYEEVFGIEPRPKETKP